jgi:hypothetical protein
METCRTGEEAKTAQKKKKDSETKPFEENLSGSLIVGRSLSDVMTCTTDLTDLKKEMSNVVTNEYTPYNVKQRDNYLKAHTGPKSYLTIPYRLKPILPTTPKPENQLRH